MRKNRIADMYKDMNQFTNQTYYTVFIPVIIVGFFVVYGGLTYLWNRKWLPRQRARGAVIMPFGMIIKNATKIAMREDTLKFLPKVDNKITNKFLTLKALNWGLLIFTFALLFAKNGNFWLPFVFLILSIWIRTTKILNQRKQILIRMFAVASSVFRYGKGSDLQPWNYVKIKKWESFTVPGETHANIPATWDASSPTSRDGFERHFNTTVTNDNSWIYEWKSADGFVICQPITHLPQRAPYPEDGSKKYEWYEIPLGLGASGEVTVDLTKTPHMLICGTTGSGKALSLNTPILTSVGWKRIGTLETGDRVYGTDGKLHNVNHIHPTFTPPKAYRITLKTGESFIVNGEHLWETLSKRDAVNSYQNKISPLLSWVDTEHLETIYNRYKATDNSETISIPELKKITGLTTSSALYRITKQAGIAEVVQKTIQYGYKENSTIGLQRFTALPKGDFLKIYNERNIHPTVKHPITSFMYEKLKEFRNEIDFSDNVTFEDVIMHTGGTTTHNKLSITWFTENLDLRLGAKNALSVAIEKAEQVVNPFPTKIFNIETEQDLVTYMDLHALSPLASLDEAKSLFFRLSKKSSNRSLVSRTQERFFPTKTETVQPINTYPKKLVLRIILQRAGYNLDESANYAESRIVTTKEMMDKFKSENYLYRGDTLTSSDHYIRTPKPLTGVENITLPVAPYTLGAYLGDGMSSSGRICGEDWEVFENIQKEGYTIQNISSPDSSNPNFKNVTFKGLGKALRLLHVSHSSRKTVKEHGEVKIIPDIYLTANEASRRQLLRGLLDTDGSIKSDGRVSFGNTNYLLIMQVMTLVASLGYAPILEQGGKPSNENHKQMWQVIFTAPSEDNLFGLNRKNTVHALRNKKDIVNHLNAFNKVLKIEEVTPEPMRCISVDTEDRLFLIGRSLIPTHNSVLQRNLIFHCIQHNDMWRFLGVDVKRVELTPFKKYTQTVLGIGPNLEDGVEIVRYAKKVMETRYEKMEEAGVNHFKDLIDPATGKPHYAIMLMVDEAFMFMSPEGAKTDEGKARDQLHGEASTMLGEIARLGRASGVHLVLATQRPDATVIKGELKANLDIRIAAGRLDSTPSMMVLDSGAATMLPGDIKGRGIVRFGGEQEQFQGYFAEQDWIDQWLEKHPGVEPELYPAKGGSIESEDGVLDELTQLSEGIDFEDGIIAPLEEEVAAPATPFSPVSMELPTAPVLPTAPSVAQPTVSASLPFQAPQVQHEVSELPAEEELDDDALSFINSFLAQGDDDSVSRPASPATPAVSVEPVKAPGLPALPAKPGFPSTLPALPAKGNSARPVLPPLPSRK